MPEFFKKEIRKLWMPLTKTSDGGFRGILSDTSIDRDDEMMSKKLLESWAKNSTLPMLADHQNKMESWIGGWSDLQTVTKGKNTALTAKFNFFTVKANPKAQQVKEQIEQALDMGLPAGISIGAIPQDYKEVEIKEKTRKQWITAELVEGTVVPVQSNRNASAYVHKSYNMIAKSFELEKPAKLDRCVRQLMADPKFKPKGGKSKEESAYAVCQESIKSGITPEEVINKMPHEEEDEEDKKKPKKDEKKSLSLKKEYLQKFYPTKKMMREQINKAVADKLEEIGKEWRVKCNKYLLKTLQKQIIVKKGEEYPMPDSLEHKKKDDLEDADPSMTNFARASQGMDLEKKPKKPKSGDN